MSKLHLGFFADGGRHVADPNRRCIYVARRETGEQAAMDVDRAALFAAAPDMLAALQNLVALIDAVQIDPNLGDETDRVFPHYEFDEARAAIAKATGN